MQHKQFDPQYLLKVVLFIMGMFFIFFGISKCLGFNGYYQGFVAGGIASVFVAIVSKNMQSP